MTPVEPGPLGDTRRPLTAVEAAERGATRIADRVVAKIAAQAAREALNPLPAGRRTPARDGRRPSPGSRPRSSRGDSRRNRPRPPPPRPRLPLRHRRPLQRGALSCRRAGTRVDGDGSAGGDGLPRRTAAPAPRRPPRHRGGRDERAQGSENATDASPSWRSRTRAHRPRRNSASPPPPPTTTRRPPSTTRAAGG